MELGWLLVMGAFSAVCVYPISGIITREFALVNAVLAVGFAFYFRMVLFFRQIPYLKFLAVQVILFFSNPLLFIKVVSKMQEIFYLIDVYDVTFFLVPGTQDAVSAMSGAYSFFKKEFVLFSIGMLILIVLAELRVMLAFVRRIKEME